MGWGTAIGVIVGGNLLYVGLRAWLGRGIRPGMLGQVSGLATKRLTDELLHLNLPADAVAALGRAEGPVLARQIHQDLMDAAIIEDAYIEEFTAALSARVRRFAMACAWKFRTEHDRAAQYEDDFQAYRLWYAAFADAAVAVNPALRVMPDGGSLCDELDADLLFEAYDAGHDPARFGRLFAEEVAFADEGDLLGVIGRPVDGETLDRLDALLRRLSVQCASARGDDALLAYEPVRAVSAR